MLTVGEGEVRAGVEGLKLLILFDLPLVAMCMEGVTFLHVSLPLGLPMSFPLCGFLAFSAEPNEREGRGESSFDSLFLLSFGSDTRGETSFSAILRGLLAFTGEGTSLFWIS